MPKAIRIIDDCFENAVIKFAAGKVYPLSDETARLVALGHAEECNVKADEINPVPSAADLAAAALNPDTAPDAEKPAGAE